MGEEGKKVEIRTDIPIDRIKSFLNIRNERVEIEDLKNSIEQHGLLQPIIVSPSRESFHLVAGHRRVLACRELGYKEIPAVIQTFSSPETIQITENIQRSDMSKKEESKAVFDLMNKLGCRKSDLARILGKDPGWVHKRLSFHEVREYLISESFSSKSVNELTYDIATEMVRYDERYWKKLASMSLGKKWYPEKLKRFYYSVTHPGNKSNDNAPANKLKDDLGVNLDKSEKNAFSIEADDYSCIMKLLFVEKSTYQTVKDALLSFGGELI